MDVRLPKEVSADYLEQLNNRVVQENPTSLNIELADFERSHLFAEGRLLGILSLMNHRETPVYLKMGSILSSYDHKSIPNKYWKLFVESVFGLILTELAAGIHDLDSVDYGPLIRERISGELNKGNGIISVGNEITAPIIDKTPSPKSSLLVKVLEEEAIRRFPIEFWSLLFKPLGLTSQNKDDFNSLREYAFETIRNTWEHGYTDVDNKPIQSIRFISVRRLNLTRDSYKLSRTEVGPASSYIETLPKRLNTSYVKREPDSLVEITIADSGIGIPARMAGSLDIYKSKLEEERKYLLKALQPTGTSKKDVPGAGLGLPKVMEATKHLKGLIVFRTGRLCMYRNYLEENQCRNVLELDEWFDSPCSLIGGTAISLIFPWMQADQPSFDFS